MSDMDGLDLAELVRLRQVSPEELLQAAVARAEAAQTQINCFAAIYPEIAGAQIAAGGLEGPYAGVPFVVKDLGVEVKGAPMTGGSRAYRGNVASRDSTLVERFRKAGLVFFASTTTPEFGLTLTTESTLYGQTRNPPGRDTHDRRIVWRGGGGRGSGRTAGGACQRWRRIDPHSGGVLRRVRAETVARADADGTGEDGRLERTFDRGRGQPHGARYGSDAGPDTRAGNR